LFFSISDYKSGEVEISILGAERNVLYANLFKTELSGVSTNIVGYIPKILKLDFRNFSGKLKVHITRND
jgi:hypothetical protein